MELASEFSTTQLKSLTPSTLAVLNALNEGGSLNAAQLQEITGYSMRTIRYSLRNLLDREMVSKKLNLSDMRITEYQLILTSSPVREETKDLRVRTAALKAKMSGVRTVR
ncbi:MAG: ArsR family transcriptional regulator [Candidatus Hodarchaeales archaeon]